MARFPDKLTVRVISEKGSAPVMNVAVGVTILATRKNNYGVGPFLTDSTGTVTFTREDCIESIRTDQKMFLMDYWGDLDDCRPEFEVRLWPPENISRMLENYESDPEFWGAAFKKPDEHFKALKGARNAEFMPATLRVHEEEILRNPRVVLEVRSKGGSCH